MLSIWDNVEIEAARLNESRARADIDDLRQTINDTRRLILASRKLLDRIAADAYSEQVINRSKSRTIFHARPLQIGRRN